MSSSFFLLYSPLNPNQENKNAGSAYALTCAGNPFDTDAKTVFLPTALLSDGFDGLIRVYIAITLLLLLLTVSQVCALNTDSQGNPLRNLSFELNQQGDKRRSALDPAVRMALTPCPGVVQGNCPLRLFAESYQNDIILSYISVLVNQGLQAPGPCLRATSPQPPKVSRCGREEGRCPSTLQGPQALDPFCAGAWLGGAKMNRSGAQSLTDSFLRVYWQQLQR